MLQVDVLCGVFLHVFEPWSVVGVLVFGTCVRASIVVHVTVRLLSDDVQGVFGGACF